MAWFIGQVTRRTHQQNRIAKERPSSGRLPGSCSVHQSSSLGPFWHRHMSGRRTKRVGRNAASCAVSQQAHCTTAVLRSHVQQQCSMTSGVVHRYQQTTSQCCLATNPGVIFLVLNRTPSSIRAASRCRVRLPVTDADDCPFVGRDMLKICDRAAMHPSRTGDRMLRQHTFAHVVHVGSFVVRLEARWRSCSPQRPRRHSHLPPPRFHLAAWEVAGRVLRQNRWCQHSDRTK